MTRRSAERTSLRVKAVNTWGLGLISTNREGTKRYFHFDGLGSTRALTDGSETVADTYEYNAFGVLESSTGTSVNPFRYVGQYGYYDDGAMGSSSGLLLLGVRYYSPAHGRFWSWDPVPNLNLYGYVGNSATMAIDPSGAVPIVLILCAVACAGCVVCAAAVCYKCGDDIDCWIRCLQNDLPWYCGLACAGCVACLLRRATRLRFRPKPREQQPRPPSGRRPDTRGEHDPYRVCVVGCILIMCLWMTDPGARLGCESWCIQYCMKNPEGLPGIEAVR